MLKSISSWENQTVADSHRQPKLQQIYDSPRVYFIIATMVYAIWAAIWQVETVPIHVYIAAITIAATCMMPLMHWYSGERHSVPLFELIVLSFAIQFSMPIFTQPNVVGTVIGSVRLHWDKVFLALVYTECGIAALLTGYYILGTRGLLSHLPKMNLVLHPHRRAIYLWMAVVFGAIFNLLIVTNRLSATNAIVLLVGRQLNIAIAILSYYVYRNQLTIAYVRVLFYFAVLIAFLAGLVSGMLEFALIPLVLVFIVRWEATGSLPWRLILVGAFLFLTLNPAKSEYRSLVRMGEVGDGFVERVTIWVDIATTSAVEFFDFTDPTDIQISSSSSLARLDLIHRFAHVVTTTPAIVPHYEGQTYTYLLSAWVPRVFWPGKPIASHWNRQMDLDYLLLHPSNYVTSIGVGVLAEAYANFGFVGIILIMLLIGILLGVFNTLLNGPQSEGGKAIYLSVMIFFLNGIGTGTALLLGGLFQYIIANAIILRFFTGESAKETNKYLIIGT